MNTIQWAAETLDRLGCTLAAKDEKNTWEVILPDGSYEDANSVKELIALARKVQSGHQHSGSVRNHA